jgi:predicted GNAT family acetyltransferase
MAQRIHRAESAVQPQGVPGAMRRADERDRPLLVEWSEAFAAEAVPHAPAGDADEMVRERLAGVAGAGLFLWEHGGRPVSLAGCAGRTPNGIRVGPVYTPPDFRGHGYASALTAALTRTLLDGGRRFCFLYTDLANPTSNRIYERIGYRPVSDVDEYRFV